MIPGKTFLQGIATLIASDPATLAPVANGCKVHLAAADFNPAVVNLVTDFTEATFTGATALVAGVGAQQSFYDPVRQQRIIQMLEPAGGWHWMCTVAPSPAQNIFGYYLTDNASAVFYASTKFDAAIPIANIGDSIDIAQARFVLAPNALS